MLVGLLCGAGCRTGDDGGGTGAEGGAGASPFGPGPAARASYQAALGQKLDAVASAGTAFHQRSTNLVKIASGDFTRTLATMPPATSSIAVYDQALQGMAGDYARMMSAAFDAATARPPAATSAPLRTENDVEAVQQPLFFAVAAIVIPFAVAGYNHIKNIYDARTQPVVMRIMTATNEELTLIKQTMKLPVDFNRVQTLDHFQNKIGFGERAAKSKEIEASLTLNPDGLANVRPFGQEVNVAVANSAVEAGKAAVDLVVSASSNATGGSGLKEVGQAAGLSAKTAEVVDLTIQAVQTATGQPLQPLDLLSSQMQAVVNGGDTKEVTLPPAGTTTAEQARATLSQADPPAQKLGEATAVLTRDMLAGSGGGGDLIKTRDAPDGGKVVSVPGRTHILTTDDVKNSTTLSVLNVGRADVVVAAKGHRPQTIPNVALVKGAVIKYRVEPPAAMPSPVTLCASGDYSGAFKLYKAQDRSDGDAYIVTATCAFGFYDYRSAESLALRGAQVSSKGGRAHNYFIAEYAAERRGATGGSYGTAGIAAAKESGQCSGSSNGDVCASLYQNSVRSGLDRYQMDPR